MNKTERLLYGIEPNAKERIKDLQRELDHETFEVEKPVIPNRVAYNLNCMSQLTNNSPELFKDQDSTEEREYYDEQLEKPDYSKIFNLEA